MDVAVFRTFKSGWKESVKKWRSENMNKPVLKKIHFGPLLKQCIDDRVRGEVLQNGFRKCGFYPWNASAVDYSKVATKRSNREEGNAIRQLYPSKEKVEEAVAVLEHYIGCEKIKQFNSCDEWQGKETCHCTRYGAV